VRELGVYLADGTLLAVWSHPTQALAYKTAGSDMLLSYDLVLSALPPNSVTVDGTGGLSLPSATDTQMGILRLANAAEIAAHTDTTTAVHPAGVATIAQAAVAQVVGAAPALLDTLDELAQALGDDANYAATITAQLAGKEPAITPKGSAFNPNYGTTPGTVVDGGVYTSAINALNTSLAGKEPAITPKGSAFNANYGTTSGTVVDGGVYTSAINSISGAVNSINVALGNMVDMTTLTAALATKEPTITPKRSGFNLDIGTTSTTLAHGAHVHNYLGAVAWQNIATYAVTLAPNSTFSVSLATAIGPGPWIVMVRSRQWYFNTGVSYLTLTQDGQVHLNGVNQGLTPGQSVPYRLAIIDASNGPPSQTNTAYYYVYRVNDTLYLTTNNPSVIGTSNLSIVVL
jgi:hypothetical protein